MNESIFWVWNGWGILFTIVVAIWFILHMYVTLKYGSGTPFRNILAVIVLLAVGFTFLLSGWIAGLLAIPIGMTVGIVLARLVLPR